MLSKTIAAAFLLLTTTSLAAPVAQPDLEFIEVGMSEPRSLLSRLLPRSYTPHCNKGVRVWGVRGSTAVRGDNPMSQFAHQVAQASAGSFGSDLPYPAASNADISAYEASVVTGGQMLTQRITSYVDRCPGSKIALLGYSQGAQVIANVLIGDGTSTGGLAQQYNDAILAVATFGDPSYVPNIANIDMGSATTAGVVPRPNAEDYISMGYAGRVQIFCEEGDRWCSNQDGPDGYTIHDSEPQIYGAQALAWMTATIAAAGL